MEVKYFISHPARAKSQPFPQQNDDNSSSKTRGVCIQAYFTCEYNLHSRNHKQIERSQRQSHLNVHHCLYSTRKREWQCDNSVWIHNSHNRFITVRQCRRLFASKGYYHKQSNLIGKLWQNDLSGMSQSSCSQQDNKTLEERKHKLLEQQVFKDLKFLFFPSGVGCKLALLIPVVTSGMKMYFKFEWPKNYFRCISCRVVNCKWKHRLHWLHFYMTVVNSHMSKAV